MRTKEGTVYLENLVEAQWVKLPAGMAVEPDEDVFVLSNPPADWEWRWYWEDHGIELTVEQIETGYPFLPKSPYHDGLNAFFILLAFVLPPVGIPALVILWWKEFTRRKKLNRWDP